MALNWGYVTLSHLHCDTTGHIDALESLSLVVVKGWTVERENNQIGRLKNWSLNPILASYVTVGQLSNLCDLHFIYLYYRKIIYFTD